MPDESTTSEREAKREAVARIIDPNKWALIDHWRRTPNRPDLEERVPEAASYSLAKADTILALTSAPTPARAGRPSEREVMRNVLDQITDDHIEFNGPRPSAPTPAVEDRILVPRVPTQAMIEAWMAPDWIKSTWGERYAALLAAAPQPATVTSQDNFI